SGMRTLCTPEATAIDARRRPRPRTNSVPASEPFTRATAAHFPVRQPRGTDSLRAAILGGAAAAPGAVSAAPAGPVGAAAGEAVAVGWPGAAGEETAGCVPVG